MEKSTYDKLYNNILFPYLLLTIKIVSDEAKLIARKLSMRLTNIQPPEEGFKVFDACVDNPVKEMGECRAKEVCLRMCLFHFDVNFLTFKCKKTVQKIENPLQSCK